ncbi:MAG: fused MFS/spermidine synthase [Alphaproteobacteria bacterium]|nr:fused MFS/spermidine synthase [Alphaproteobacteria bacterium]
MSLAEYIHALFGLLLQKRPRHVLMIGCAGGTLATMLSRAGIQVTLVDIDPLSFEIAHRYFHMPEAVNCHVRDGAEFLRRTKARYDAVILDAFADTIIPPHLLTERFFRLARSRLNRGGLFLVNIVVKDDDDPTPDTIARTMRKAWRQVRLLDADGFENRNAVAMGGAVRGLKRPRLLMKPAHGSRALEKSLAQLFFRRLRQPIA